MNNILENKFGVVADCTLDQTLLASAEAPKPLGTETHSHLTGE